MPVDSTHPEYDASDKAWSRARVVIAGEDAVKRAGVRYLRRLEEQSDDEYAAYKSRAAFFNATARTADGFVGMIFRRAPFLRLPGASLSAGQALAAFVRDVDMRGTTLFSYAKHVVTEVIAVGRAGTLVDWEDEVEDRVYLSAYAAENILNWRVERVNGRNVVTLVVLREEVEAARAGAGPAAADADEFEAEPVEQIRVLRLGRSRRENGAGQRRVCECEVEIWRRDDGGNRRPSRRNWRLVATRSPRRRGRPLPALPFVFHGPGHSRPAVDKLPLADLIAVNLDHYRLDADYKHGIHFTALPTAWVSGFDKNASLRIGSSTAWVTETAGATAGFLEFTGQGLTTFERAMDRDERLMAVLGSRLLAAQKKGVGETSDTIELRSSGENSILSALALSVGESLTQALRWACWWNSTEEIPEQIGEDQVWVRLNTDFSTQGLAADQLAAVVAAWQAGALQDAALQEILRKGEMLPDGLSAPDAAKAGGGVRPGEKVNA
jgi:hypothetical protein